MSVSGSGVSVDVGGGQPSQAEQDIALAYDGGSNFVGRLQALSDAKSRHDEALAELNLGKAAKAALDDAQRQQAETQAKLAEADTALNAAKQTATDTMAKAQQNAEDLVAKAKTDADALVAEATRMRADAQRDKNAAAKDRAAASAEREALRVEREAGNRLAEEAETTRSAFQAKTDRLHAVLAEIGAPPRQ